LALYPLVWDWRLLCFSSGTIRKKKATENMNDQYLKEKFIETESGKIAYYSDISFGNNLTIVFLHGLSSNHTTWIGIIKKIHDAGYNSIAMDIRGHGLSDKSKNKKLYNLETFTDDLELILNKENIQKAFFAGYSFGGTIALNYALVHPKKVSGLILISVNHVNPFVYWKINFLTPLAYYFLGALAFLLLWQKREKYYYYIHGRSSKGYWDSTWFGLNTMPLSVNIWLIMQFGLLDMRGKIDKLSAPTVMIKAHGDPFLTDVEANEMLRSIKNSKLIIAKHDSHFLATRAQEEISEIILDFIGKLVR
jgi:pimeloyl-ACP methyl ester carboxylesterase